MSSDATPDAVTLPPPTATPSLPAESPAGPATASATPPVENFRALEPDVVSLWRLNSGIEWAILLSLAFVAITVGGIVFALGVWFWVLLAAWALVAMLAVVQTIWYPPLAYRHFAYRVADRVIEVRRGVWFRESRLVPLSRIQHVDLRQGLFERSYGLATLVFHTAGMHESSTVLPGLSAGTAAALRDQLMAQLHERPAATGAMTV
ncbi:MAG: PH domain-containing protein [Chloracidobacterium sp.]|nr:PH domain-containing protein [Chloracidobacterium sp.]MDW8217938.1 PH domain-containing protein [Acidobacteriota bacterium]